MNIKSLTLKNKLVDETTGEFYYDLTAPSFIYDADLGIKALHYVMRDQVSRIDKISNIYFGSTEFIDAICVVNNIFNPFSIQEGDILVIPNLSRPDEVYKKPETISRPNVVQEPFINANNQSQKDQSRIQRLLKIAKEKKSGVNTPLPPNMLQPGKDPKVFEDGLIKLGSNLPSNNMFINSRDTNNS